jgi:hypothetical protein
MAKRFVKAGYGVVIEDVVLPDALRMYLGGFANVESPVHAVALLPELEVVLGRDGANKKSVGRASTARTREVYFSLIGMNEIARIQPGSRSPEEVADELMELAASGNALLKLNESQASRASHP